MKENEYLYSGEVTYLTIHSKAHGKVKVCLDTEDLPRIRNISWHVKTNSNGKLYVYGTVGKSILLHRLITSFEWDIVDHVDGDPLNNKKINLRKASVSQNGMNRLPNRKKDPSIHWKGVVKRGCKFRAYVTLNKKQIHLGYYENAIDAAKAYNLKALEVFGSFARVNEINEAA